MPNFVYSSPSAYFVSPYFNLSPYLTSMELVSEDEEVDVSTFSAPRAKEPGKVTDSITATMRWHPTLYSALSPYVNTDRTLNFIPVSGTVIAATVRYGTVPFGTFEEGAAAETALVLHVKDQITLS